MSIKLRPHHLLCTQGYSGKGYNQEFIENTNRITQTLRTEQETEVEIVFSTDDMCSQCGRRLGEDLCKDNEKVKRFDRKVTEYFGIEEKTYIYQQVTAKINAGMTEAIMADICRDCGWYPVSSCRKNILKEAAEQ